MIFRTNIAESLARNTWISVHIEEILNNLGQTRSISRFRKIFERDKPEIVSTSVLNLHDQNTGFTNFLKNLDSLILSQDFTIKTFISLLEKFEVSLADDNIHLVSLLDSFDTQTLVLMLDSITLYNQTRTSKNINIFLSNLVDVLSKRQFIGQSEYDMDLVHCLIGIINRINRNSPNLRKISLSINKQIRSNIDVLIEKGTFTHTLNLLSYTLDPTLIYTVVHTCIFKLEKFGHSDLGNLPKFLFNFKIHDEEILQHVITHSSTSPLTSFESQGNSYNNFISGLFLFDDLFHSFELSFRPIVRYFQMLKDKVDLFRDELYFFLSSIKIPYNLYKTVKEDYTDLINQILLKIGVISHDKMFENIPHLNNDQLVCLIKCLINLQVEVGFPGWESINKILINGDFSESNNTVDDFCGRSFFNDFSKQLSARLLKEIPQNCTVEDLDDSFKHLDSVEALLFMLNKAMNLNVDRIYTNSMTLSIKRLLSLTPQFYLHKPDLLDFFKKVKRLNPKLLSDLSMELFDISGSSDLQLFEVGLRFKLLNLKNNDHTDGYSDMVKDFDSFEVLGKETSRESFELVVKLLNLIGKTKDLVGEELKADLESRFIKFSELVYNFLEKDTSLINYKAVQYLLNLDPKSKIHSQVIDLMESRIDSLKVPQLVAVFIYRLKRVDNDRELEKLEELGGYISDKMDEFANILENTFAQRVWIYDQSEENRIKKVNPWVNEHGLKYLFKGKNEHFDMFLYEKCKDLDQFFKLHRYNGEEVGGEGINSLHELKMELIQLNKQITREEMKFMSIKGGKEFEKVLEVVGSLASKVRRCILAVEMCKASSRDYYLPKKHTKELVKLSLRKFKNENVISC